jgi:O-methyltransferase
MRMNPIARIAKRLPTVRTIKQHAAALNTAKHDAPPTETIEDKYLHLLKRSLTRFGLCNDYQHIPVPGLDRLLASRRLAIVRVLPPDSAARIDGSLMHPSDAETMIGLTRLDHLQDCIVDVLNHDVPGDLIEAGVWRGGATIFMRAVLEARGDTERTVWVADSFEGLPKPDAAAYPADAGDIHWTLDHLAVSLDEVKENFERYGLLDQRVRFVKGWFKDTLLRAPIERLAILRVDADMYGSTLEVFQSLYSKVSVGGYVIIDDYGAVPGCSKAVDGFRAENRITEEIKKIDWTGVYWQKLG